MCLLTNRKMPEREDDHLTPATRLLEKRREMAEVEQALAAQKEVSLVLVQPGFHCLTVCVCVCVCGCVYNIYV